MFYRSDCLDTYFFTPRQMFYRSGRTLLTVVVLAVVVGAEVVIAVVVVVAELLPPFAKVAISGKPTTVPIKHKTKVIIRSALSLFRLLHLVNAISSLIFSRHRECMFC